MAPLVLAFLHVVVLTLTESTQNYFAFQKHTAKLAWPKRLGSGWEVRSKLECATRCLQSYPKSCYGYLYNTVNRTCLPSSGLSPYATPATLSDGDFYFSDSMNAYPDFKSYSYLDNITLTSIYAGYFTIPLNYTSARDTCRSMHSQLFVAKSISKYDVFKYITKDDNSDWIGLNDMANEGHFVWEDDGQEITTIMKSFLFKPPQPDNSDGIENCAYKQSITEQDVLHLNDAPCSALNSYVCEMRTKQGYFVY